MLSPPKSAHKTPPEPFKVSISVLYEILFNYRYVRLRQLRLIHGRCQTPLV